MKIIPTRFPIRHPQTGALALGLRKDGRPIWPIAGADGTASVRTTGHPMLDRLYDERDKAVEFIETTLVGAADQKRDLSESEQTTLGQYKDRITALDKQIEPIEAFEQLRALGNQASRQYRPAGQPVAGGAANGGQTTGLGAGSGPRPHEYRSRGEVIVDLLTGNPEYQGRGLKRAGQTHTVGETELRAAQERLWGAGLSVPGLPQGEQRIANQTTANTPGLLPEPIVGAVVNDLDSSRPFVSSIGAKDLGSIPGKTFSRPVVTQHTQVGTQAAEKAELPSRQFVVGGVDFTKETKGGTLDVSRQDIDWTSPAVWDALLTDLQAEYAIDTENTAGDAFAAAVVSAPIEVGGDSGVQEWLKAIYAAAAQVYGQVQRLPDHMWLSLDMWAQMGPIVDAVKRMTQADQSLGSSSPMSFAGNLVDMPRTVVPSFPASTLIIGVKDRTEFYEERIGFLQAVEPRLLGVEIAYGGYIAYGTIKPEAFAKVVDAVPPA
jgi:hypothetical protein